MTHCKPPTAWQELFQRAQRSGSALVSGMESKNSGQGRAGAPQLVRTHAPLRCERALVAVTSPRRAVVDPAEQRHTVVLAGWGRQGGAMCPVAQAGRCAHRAGQAGRQTQKQAHSTIHGAQRAHGLSSSSRQGHAARARSSAGAAAAALSRQARALALVTLAPVALLAVATAVAHSTAGRARAQVHCAPTAAGTRV